MCSIDQSERAFIQKPQNPYVAGSHCIHWLTSTAARRAYARASRALREMRQQKRYMQNCSA